MTPGVIVSGVLTRGMGIVQKTGDPDSVGKVALNPIVDGATWESLNATTLRRAGTVVSLRGHIGDRTNLQAGSLERADCGFTT